MSLGPLWSCFCKPAGGSSLTGRLYLGSLQEKGLPLTQDHGRWKQKTESSSPAGTLWTWEKKPPRCLQKWGWRGDWCRRQLRETLLWTDPWQVNGRSCQSSLLPPPPYHSREKASSLARTEQFWLGTNSDDLKKSLSKPQKEGTLWEHMTIFRMRPPESSPSRPLYWMSVTPGL